MLQKCYKILQNRSYHTIPSIAPGKGWKGCKPVPEMEKGGPEYRYKKERISHTKKRGDHMPYISPNVREKFNSLSPELQDVILSRGEDIQSIHDLIRILDKIVKEGEG